MNDESKLSNIFIKLNKIIKDNKNFDLNQYNFLSIIFYDLKKCDTKLILESKSFYQIFLKEKDFIVNFVKKLEKLVDFKQEFNNFFIENNNLYYNNQLIKNINYFTKNQKNEHLIRTLFIEIPFTTLIDSFINISSTPIYFLMMKSSNNINKEFKKLKNLVLKIKNDLMILFMNLPGSIYEYEYLTIEIFQILNYMISDEFNSNDCMKKLKDKKSFDKKYRNLYEELINYL